MDEPRALPRARATAALGLPLGLGLLALRARGRAGPKWARTWAVALTLMVVQLLGDERTSHVVLDARGEHWGDVALALLLPVLGAASVPRLWAQRLHAGAIVAGGFWTLATWITLWNVFLGSRRWRLGLLHYWIS